MGILYIKLQRSCSALNNHKVIRFFSSTIKRIIYVISETLAKILSIVLDYIKFTIFLFITIIISLILFFNYSGVKMLSVDDPRNGNSFLCFDKHCLITHKITEGSYRRLKSIEKRQLDQHKRMLDQQLQSLKNKEKQEDKDIDPLFQYSRIKSKS